jgi:ribosomal protein S18 acetylase RimI-like enzyme
MEKLQPETMIRALVEADHSEVIEIVAGLPDWFDDTARTISIPIDIKHQRGFVAERQGKVVGFITLYVAEGKLNIGWLGVQPDLHRQGIGRLLLDKAEEVSRQLGVPELALYTLGEGVDYEPYERTRRFYFANGFQI